MWLKHCIASIYVVDQVKEMGLGGWRGDRILQRAGRVEAPDNSLTFCLWVSWYTGHVMRTYVAKGGGCCSASLLWCKNSYQWTSGTNLWLLAGILSGCDCCRAGEDNSATVAFSSDFFSEHKGSPRMSPNLCSFEAPCTNGRDEFRQRKTETTIDSNTEAGSASSGRIFHILASGMLATASRTWARSLLWLANSKGLKAYL